MDMIRHQVPTQQHDTDSSSRSSGSGSEPDLLHPQHVSAAATAAGVQHAESLDNHWLRCSPAVYPTARQNSTMCLLRE